ncbi:hypothetical protein [Longitalea arenae]|uniref:hypothetical protein n=1 Tax=Longitalea arenae TaxID=2812558 RepID=UPI001966E2C1|nr:hypothetical protein [Longitalea arenae]
MKTLCIRCILWVFSVLFFQHAAKAQVAPATQQTTVSPVITIEKGKQKKPKVKKQWKFTVDFDAGFASPGNADISDVFKGGLNASAGVKTAFLKDKLWIRPLGGLKYYFKDANLGETQREAFRTWKAGIELQYNAFTVKKYSFFPILRVDQNWSVNQFTKINDEKTATPAFTTTDKVLTGSGISFDAGIMVVRSGDLYVKLDYEYYKPEMTVNPELVREMLAAGIIMQEKKVYNCSSINLSVGVNLNFKK